MIADIGKRLPGHPAAVDGDSDRFRFFESIRAFLATSASAGPTVLLLDDLHLAERSALAVVRHLARATTETPLLVIATYRDNEVGGTPLHDMLTEFRRLEVGHIRTLTGLDGTGLAELVSTWAGGRAPSGLASCGAPPLRAMAACSTAAAGAARHPAWLDATSSRVRRPPREPCTPQPAQSAPQ